MKQLGLAVANYESTNGCLPPGQFSSIRNSDKASREGANVFIRLLPFFEGQAKYNIFNFNFSNGSAMNITLAGVGTSTLWCPSDPIVANAQPIDTTGSYVIPPGTTWTQAYSSYAACQGTWGLRLRDTDGSLLPGRIAAMNGAIYGYSSTRLAEVTDGTSNTMLFGEHGHSLLASSVVNTYHWWNSGYYADTMFEGYYPPNMQKKNVGTVSQVGGYDFYAMNASSFHPGGVNFTFIDGSVRFIKDSIQTWPISAGNSPSVSYDSTNRVYSIVPGGTVGVYQALTTRKGGEIISADAY
jgi:prepilin-type processing-associated H-X9-DG protein